MERSQVALRKLCKLLESRDGARVRTVKKNAGLKIGAADRMRFKKWMELRYSSEEDVMMETPSKAELSAKVNLRDSHGHLRKN